MASWTQSAPSITCELDGSFSFAYTYRLNFPPSSMAYTVTLTRDVDSVVVYTLAATATAGFTINLLQNIVDGDSDYTLTLVDTGGLVASHPVVARCEVYPTCTISARFNNNTLVLDPNAPFTEQRAYQWRYTPTGGVGDWICIVGFADRTSGSIGKSKLFEIDKTFGAAGTTTTMAQLNNGSTSPQSAIHYVTKQLTASEVGTQLLVQPVGDVDSGGTFVGDFDELGPLDESWGFFAVESSDGNHMAVDGLDHDDPIVDDLSFFSSDAGVVAIPFSNTRVVRLAQVHQVNKVPGHDDLYSSLQDSATTDNPEYVDDSSSYPMAGEWVFSSAVGTTPKNYGLAGHIGDAGELYPNAGDTIRVVEWFIDSRSQNAGRARGIGSSLFVSIGAPPPPDPDPDGFGARGAAGFRFTQTWATMGPLLLTEPDVAAGILERHDQELEQDFVEHGCGEFLYTFRWPTFHREFLYGSNTVVDILERRDQELEEASADQGGGPSQVNDGSCLISLTHRWREIADLVIARDARAWDLLDMRDREIEAGRNACGCSAVDPCA